MRVPLKSSVRDFGRYIGVMIIRAGFWGILYDSYTKERLVLSMKAPISQGL